MPEPVGIAPRAYSKGHTAKESTAEWRRRDRERDPPGNSSLYADPVALAERPSTQIGPGQSTDLRLGWEFSRHNTSFCLNLKIKHIARQMTRQVIKSSTGVNSRTGVAVLSGLSAVSSSWAYQEFLSVSRRAMLSNAEK